MKAAAKRAWGSDSLSGKRISVQGAGHVGGYLIEHLSKAGATVYVTDIDQERLKEVAKNPGVSIVGLDEIYDLDVDIYSPCALGATVNDATLERLKCQVIAGCANNQLKDETVHGPALIERGIIYAPDFLINAGGLINVYSELIGYNRKAAYDQTEKIYDYTLDIFDMAEREGIYTQLAATKMAEKRISDIGKVKSTY